MFPRACAGGGQGPEGGAWPLPTHPLQLLPPRDHLQHLRVRSLPTALRPRGDHHDSAPSDSAAVRVAGLHGPQTAAHGARPQVQTVLGRSAQEV